MTGNSNGRPIPVFKVNVRPSTRAKLELICRVRGWSFTEAVARLVDEHCMAAGIEAPQASAAETS